jgi:hypothetical protein
MYRLWSSTQTGGINLTSSNECKSSPDHKHHYKHSMSQHAIMNHTCYECAFCGHRKCVYRPPPQIDPLTLPTEDELR